MSNYASMAARIRAAGSVAQCQRLERSMLALWEAGAFTVSEFQRLDSLLVDRWMALTDANNGA